MLALVIGNRGRDRLRRFVRSLVIVILVGAASLLLMYTAFRRWTLHSQPTDLGPPMPETVNIKDQATGRPRMDVGPCWMEHRDGLWRIDLSGDARLMGHSHGLLARRVLSAVDRRVSTLYRKQVESSLHRMVLGNIARWRFRNLPAGIPPLRLAELAAFSRTMVDAPDFPEPPFHRLLYYHAPHEITQSFDISPLFGGHAFAVWGTQTVDSVLLIGRTFELHAGELFDREKALLLFRTPEQIPFLSVAWPGMMGVFTGINAQRLFVSLDPARSDDPLQAGIPLTLLVREILQQARSIKDAVELIRKTPVMVPGVLLIADGKTQEAVVVELSPKTVAIRKGVSGLLVAANHFLDPAYKADASNDWVRRYSTSEVRYKRLVQLLGRFSGRMDPPTAVMVLRTRTGLDDEPLGLGNRNALDSLSASHGLVVDLTNFILWVSRGPHLLGPFVVIDLKALFGQPVAGAVLPKGIEADPLKDSARLDLYRLAKTQLDHARWLLNLDHRLGALDFATRAASLDPELSDAFKLRGDLLWDLGRFDEAKEQYRQFIKLHPSRPSEQEDAKARLSQ